MDDAPLKSFEQHHPFINLIFSVVFTHLSAVYPIQDELQECCKAWPPNRTGPTILREPHSNLRIQAAEIASIASRMGKPCEKRKKALSHANRWKLHETTRPLYRGWTPLMHRLATSPKRDIWTLPLTCTTFPENVTAYK